jgi:hypothetical protein
LTLWPADVHEAVLPRPWILVSRPLWLWNHPKHSWPVADPSAAIGNLQPPHPLLEVRYGGPVEPDPR